MRDCRIEIPEMFMIENLTEVVKEEINIEQINIEQEFWKRGGFNENKIFNCWELIIGSVPSQMLCS